MDNQYCGWTGPWDSYDACKMPSAKTNRKLCKTQGLLLTSPRNHGAPGATQRSQGRGGRSGGPGVLTFIGVEGAT